MASKSESGAEQQKYDRQLRLWGVHGQKKLMNSHVCLLNAGPTGTETLKNLVLPGIDRSFIGKPRAAAVTALLTEINPDVKGNALTREPRELIRSDPKFFSKFSLIIATQLDEVDLIALGDICSKGNIILVVARTYGLIGHVRVFSSEHRVIELKPSPEPAPDLRVHNPWPELKKLADSIDLSKLDGFEFKHVPFVLVLIKALDEWKVGHAGKVPQNYAEKEEFKKSLKAKARLPWGEEENLSEAVANAFQAFASYRVSDDVLDVLNDSKCDQMDKDTASFWVMARALRDFFRANGSILPLPGSLPDMTATTERFVQLQQCFSEKAQKDLAAVSQNIDAILKQCGRPLDSISKEERAVLCANAGGLVVLRSRTLSEEFQNPKKSNDLGFDDPSELSPSMNPMIWYVLWRACDSVHAATSHYPGQKPTATSTELASSSKEIYSKARAILEAQYQGLIPLEALTMDCAAEMVRYGGVEMHNVAALIGGIAAEESVKLLTQQYQPLNNTFLYNGICALGRYYSL